MVDTLRSAFGVEHEVVAKGFAGAVLRRLRPAAEIAPRKPLSVDFKPITPKTATGPGSLRGRMDPTAHATQSAAKKRAG
jgi:hypothetical protein